MMNGRYIKIKAFFNRQFGIVSELQYTFLSILFLVLSVFISNSAGAQDISASLKSDSSAILIGDYLDVKLTVRFPGELHVTLPAITDTVGNMELVKASKIDTSISGNFKTFTQTYTLSAYDSGIYRAGPQRIVFRNTDGTVDTLLSDSLLITVSTVPVDTSKAFKAIKAPIDVPYTLSEFLPYIIGGIAIITAVVAIVYYMRRQRKNRKSKVIERPKPKDPAHVWAKKELKKLEEEKLWQKEEIKAYYSRLTDILRLYLEYRYNWLALESTTEKIIEDIDLYELNEEAKEILLRILNEGDLVKFAKKIPVPDLNVKVMEMGYRFIQSTEPKEMVQELK